MLAEWFAKVASNKTVTARLLLQGTEIKTSGYLPQTTTLLVKGNVAYADVEFRFADRALFDTVEWREGSTVLKSERVAYDGPRGTHQATLELEVGE
jgi:hypothetical protein